MDDEQLIYFNGIDGESGNYLTQPQTPEQLSTIARGERLDTNLKELKWWHERTTQESMGPIEGVDPKDLAQSGWGVIFPCEVDPAIKEALGELLDHRRHQAGDYYKEYDYRPGESKTGESKTEFLKRHKVGFGPADPKKMPYYLLIVADPETVPTRFQSQLDVQYAVGRIHFQKTEDYANYARSVVEAETSNRVRARQATFFGVQNPDDRATEYSANDLIAPLADSVASDQPEWKVDTLLREAATKQCLKGLLGGEQTPALLFTASHGMGFPNASPRQLPHQGALLCQDWPGRYEWPKTIPPDFYFSADDVSDKASLLGLIAFHFACYGAGTPRINEFALFENASASTRAEIAPQAFLATLPQRLLSHPKGGALAVIGHVERAWGFSFLWGKAGPQLQVFESTLKRLMEGHPIGSAFDFFNQRYAELATNLSDELEEIKFGKTADNLALASLWTAHNDARGYAIIGDPAVRLNVNGDSLRESAPPIITATSILPSLEEKPASPMAEAERQETVMSTTQEAVEYGILDSIAGAQARLASAIQNLASQLSDTLEKAISDASSLEVTTFVSDDMSKISYEGGKFTGNAQLRALTHINIDGDIVVCVPAGEGGIDERLWKLHKEMVEQARAHRAEVMQNLIQAATGLLATLKGS